jgi:hypothetical protein
MAIHIRQRELIFGGAVVALPLAARAQQPARVRRIGALAARATQLNEGDSRCIRD